MKVDIPCLSVKLVDREDVVANNYNPNNVAKDKMELLKQSIIDNGFCFPIVVIYDNDLGKYVIIDGFHRYTICSRDWLDIKQIPVVVLKHDISKRMVATVQFNKARGVHQVDMDAEIIRSLISQGLTEKDICDKLKIDAETVLRYKTLTGIVDLFNNIDYSPSWSIAEEVVE